MKLTARQSDTGSSWLLYDETNRAVAAVPSNWPNAEATAKRLVACWNHCEGFATDVLESGPGMEELVRGCSALGKFVKEEDL